MPDNYVLFSPVGSHDPVPANLRDGAMLHICRRLSPSKLYIYYSAEMLANKQKDDRYVKAVEDLCRRTGKAVDIKEYCDSDMTEVQLFDVFLPLFGGFLHDIHKENPDSTLLVNISSGTPAMKTALLLLSMTLPFEVLAVQVENPEKRLNSPELPAEYDGDVYLPLNEDNSKDAPDRCHIGGYPNLRAEITRQSVCSHIGHYDYEAALREAKEIAEFLQPYSLTLLSGAVGRIKMNPASLRNALRGEDKAVLTELAGDRMGIFEYMLWLQMKFLRGDLSDFIRGFTPALYRLTEKQLSNIGVDLSPYIYLSKRKEKILRRDLLSSDGAGGEYLHILDERFGGAYKDGPLNSEICITLIIGLSKDIKFKDELMKLRDFEAQIRNRVAHDIDSMDDEKIKILTGFVSADIWKSMKYVTQTILTVGGENWNAYKRMNELLIREIKKTY